MYSYISWCEEATRNRIDAITTVWNLALRSAHCTDHAGLNDSLIMLDNLHKAAKELLASYCAYLEKNQMEEEKTNGSASSH